jgi:hypothetical protein
MNERLLSMHQSATRKGVSTIQIQRAIEAGDLPAIEQGGAYFIDPVALDAWEPHMNSSAGADMNLDEANEHIRNPS